MASNLFQPAVSDVNSAVTPTEGVVNTAAVDLFSAIGQTAVSVTKSKIGEQALSDLAKGASDITAERQSQIDNLQRNFDKMAQVRDSGGDVSKLQIKARALLDKTKASAPWLSNQADEIFNNTFGGGKASNRSGSLFEETPEEKALKARNERVAEIQLRTGLPWDKANQRVQLLEQRDETLKDLELQAKQRTANDSTINVAYNKSLIPTRASGMQALHKIVKEKGAINQEDRRGLVGAYRASVMAQFDAVVTAATSEQGEVLISKEGLDALQRDAEDAVKSYEAVLGENDLVKLLAESNTLEDAKTAAIINSDPALKAVKVMKEIGGEQAAAGFIQFTSDMAKGNVLIANFRKAGSPYAQFFNDEGQLVTAIGTSMGKLVNPPTDFSGKTAEVKPTPALTEGEALVAGGILNTYGMPVPMFQAVLKASVGDLPNTSATASLYQKNPDALKMAYQQKFREFLTASPKEGGKYLDAALKGARVGLVSLSMMEGQGELPPDFEVVEGGEQKDARQFSVPLPDRVRSSGDLSHAQARRILDIYYVFKKNPSYLKEFGTKNGNPDMSANEAAQVAIYGAARTNLNPKAPEDKPSALASEITKLQGKRMVFLKEHLTEEEFNKLTGGAESAANQKLQ